ncbi:hypothetical protein [Dactylosporangium sp. CA-092794]|uniref:hypothetical protein n=1 Tax=Dactylosporangium sp. CA-092794 TaxID=3239929 RepID=UPI003D938A7C
MAIAAPAAASEPPAVKNARAWQMRTVMTVMTSVMTRTSLAYSISMAALSAAAE